MKRRPFGWVMAFSLIEMLVAIAVLSVLSVLFLQMIVWTGRGWADGRQLTDNLSKSRAALDMIARDVQSGVLRPDLGAFVSSASSPANFCLFVARNGRGTRDVSLVRYRLGTNAVLERQALAVDWDNALPQNLSFGTNTIPAASSLDTLGSTTELASGVVAFSVYFLNTGPGGSSPAFQTNYTNAPTTSSRALGVGMIVLDERSQALLADQGRLDTFLDATAWDVPPDLSRGLRAGWQQAVDIYLQSPEGLALPENVRKGIRVFETVLPLPNIPPR